MAKADLVAEAQSWACLLSGIGPVPHSNPKEDLKRGYTLVLAALVQAQIPHPQTEPQEVAMIIDCPTCKERKIIVPNQPDGKSYICRKCYAALFNTLMNIIRPAQTPHLTLVNLEHKENVA
jgi:hypothetical protein